ncbi:MAG TPA: Calx-beta domain-containing protein [Verrucomicrobiae bacterium]|jgi:hypothetical protein|nr:Calx-beta domain-containing protein [Verrucomicrobiae bacterium]
MTEGYLNHADYTDVRKQVVSFLAGQLSRTVSVTITDDTTIETNETFGFIVQRNSVDPDTTYLAKSTFTITDDDLDQPTYSILPDPATVNEGAENLTFTIVRSGPTPAAVVEVRTIASEGYSNDGDYVNLDQTVPFATGQIAAIVSVNINDDTIAEYDETFGIIVERTDNDSGTNYLAKTTFTIMDDDRPAVPLITNLRLSGTTFTLSVGSQAGFKDVLEYKNTLNDAIWIPVQTNSGNGETIGLTNTGVIGSSRFYRVHVQ